LTFRDWIRQGEHAVPGRPAPTLDDLAYHQTTLFPPVRARGHLEVRYLDAQPGDGWRVPAAVVSALVQDRRAGDLAREACEETGTLWRDAARSGVHHPALRASATRGASALGVHQLLGDVWEWTATDFHGYPGFRSWPYREYSEVFFGPEYKVLRGGSFGTDPAACRSTFRNWDYPIRRQIRWWTDEQELFSFSLWAAA